MSQFRTKYPFNDLVGGEYPLKKIDEAFDLADKGEHYRLGIILKNNINSNYKLWMKKIELVVFDMAGTTVDEDNVVYKTVQKAINEEGYNITLPFVLEHGAGKEKHQAIKDVLLNMPENFSYEQTEVISKKIFENFKIKLNLAYEALEVTSYSGVEDLIKLLKDKKVKVALNTGYNSLIAKKLLNKMNWKQGIHYDALITADDVTNGRPKPDMILKAMDVLNVSDASKVLKAGDSAIDIEEGKNAGCGLTVGVTTGAQTREQLELANPSFILDSLSELKEFIEC